MTMLSSIALLVVVSFIQVSRSQKQNCDLQFPNSYIAYYSEPGSIVVDGKLDEKAWEEVEWTDQFQDILGKGNGPDPWFFTKAKMRYDTQYFYFAALFEETQIWAFKTVHDSEVYLDNAFEIFVGPDASNHWYKEYQINAINVDWDLELDKPYSDGGKANSSWETLPEKMSAVYVEGKVNDPSIAARYWSMEIAISFNKLVVNQEHIRIPPQEFDQWRVTLSRVQWKVSVVNGKYVKDNQDPGTYWLWSPHLNRNMHLPERFGYVQFSKNAVNTTKFIEDESWNARYILHEVYYSQRDYFEKYGVYSNSIEKLETLPDYVKKGTCLEVPEILSNSEGSEYIAKVKYMDNLIAHIRQDRYFWISK